MVKYMVQDTISSLRPKLTLFSTLQEADAAVHKLEEELLVKALEVLPALKRKMKPTDDSSLAVISEEEDYADQGDHEDDEDDGMSQFNI